jgi:hypothetical protein
MKAPRPDALLAEQARINREADAVAPLYGGHRAYVMRALSAAAPPGAGGRVALVGAGNCNDVDLPALARLFREIHLVDVDAAALARATARQPPEVRERLVPHAPVDVGGVLGRLGAWKTRGPGPSELEEAVNAGTAAALADVGARCDVAASLCAATQMSRHVSLALGDGHAGVRDVRRAMTTVHLRVLSGLLEPGGTGVFLTDLVSTDTYPLDTVGPDEDLAQLAEELGRQGNFFFGSDPVLFNQIVRKDPVLQAEMGPRAPIQPWLWQVKPDRLMLVTGFSFPRR